MSLLTKVRFVTMKKFGNLMIGNKSYISSAIRQTLSLFEVSVPSHSRVLPNSRAFCQETEVSEEESKRIIDPSKDRSKVIPVEVSVKYLQSLAYKTTYGNEPVWTYYRRNYKGQVPPKKTRKMCIRNNLIATGNPCPICRDEYLVIHPKNAELLRQFISPHTGAVLSYELTGLCQKRHFELLVAIMQAKDMGVITFDVPFQKYDYSEYIDLSKVQ